MDAIKNLLGLSFLLLHHDFSCALPRGRAACTACHERGPRRGYRHGRAIAGAVGSGAAPHHQGTHHRPALDCCGPREDGQVRGVLLVVLFCNLPSNFFLVWQLGIEFDLLTDSNSFLRKTFWQKFDQGSRWKATVKVRHVMGVPHTVHLTE